MSAEDLKLAEFILTKPEDRLKRKGSTDANSRIDHDDAIDSDYEESEEEIAMIMKKGSKNIFTNSPIEIFLKITRI